MARGDTRSDQWAAGEFIRVRGGIKIAMLSIDHLNVFGIITVETRCLCNKKYDFDATRKGEIQTRSNPVLILKRDH